MICPPETQVSQMSKVNPKVIDLFRETVAFMLKPQNNSEGT